MHFYTGEYMEFSRFLYFWSTVCYTRIGMRHSAVYSYNLRAADVQRVEN